ncbi:hypothetical protein BDR05DRAFT_429893 [Suillus weaverae]|nr:hypothetical protein BDR05DRAFT_429893 [Suillus weaverae]
MSITDQTRHYRLSDATREAVVNRYIISGSPVNGKDKKSVLHWRLFVKCTLPSGDTQNIQLDLVPGQDGSTGVLTATERRYELSKSSVADVPENATARITVQDLLNLLEFYGRNRYVYDSTGSGCRFWCRTVLGDLEGRGLVAIGAVNKFDTYIVSKNKGNSARFPLPTRQGRFY